MSIQKTLETVSDLRHIPQMGSVMAIPEFIARQLNEE
jgi:hypothetical protein